MLSDRSRFEDIFWFGVQELESRRPQTTRGLWWAQACGAAESFGIYRDLGWLVYLPPSREKTTILTGKTFSPSPPELTRRSEPHGFSGSKARSFKVDNNHNNARRSGDFQWQKAD